MRLVTSPRDPPRSGIVAAADKGGGRQRVFMVGRCGR